MQGFMITLLLCSAAMSVPVLFYMAVTPVLAKHYSAKGCYYAWLIFVIGLLIPFRPQFGNPVVKIDVAGSGALPVIRIGHGGAVNGYAPMSPITSTVDVFHAAVSKLSWWQIAAAVWLGGMILFLAYHVVRHYRFLKLTARWSETVTDDQILALFRKVKTQMGISREVSLKRCDVIGSPMMTGFKKPGILLPKAHFTENELYFILKHELIHYKRKDLWYKCLVLVMAAVHWFNPVVHLMVKAVNIQCELSCDAEVVGSEGEDARQYYSETIIGVVRYGSKLKTALSTNFYGGKNGMKKRIFSIMDKSNKRAGVPVLFAAFILTMGTGVAFAANVSGSEMQYQDAVTQNASPVTPWISVDFIPDPAAYAPYAAFGITISEDGRKLLYEGQPVRQFVDEQAAGWAFYLDESGSGNLTVIRNDAGEITGMKRITEQKAQEYFERFFAEELTSDYPREEYKEPVKDVAWDLATENFQEGGNKYEQYQPFGITCTEAGGALFFHGQRVQFFIDQRDHKSADALWIDPDGTANVAVVRDASGQITGVESISEEKAQEYRTAFGV